MENKPKLPAALAMIKSRMVLSSTSRRQGLHCLVVGRGVQSLPRGGAQNFNIFTNIILTCDGLDSMSALN